MRTLTALLLLSIALAARAQLTIEITQGSEGAQPIAIVPFASEALLTPEEDIAAIVSADLRRSGRFDPLSPQTYQARPASFEDLDFERWRSLRVDHVAVGRIRLNPDGGYNVRFALADVFQSDQLLDQSFNIGRGELRRLAHHISDMIYERLTGERGAFNTRIAYVSASPGSYTLSVADADGFNPQTILRSREPLLSPSWSPDGRQLAYVTFENRRPEIVVQNVYTGSRRVVSSAPGINGAPAWSPDGRRLAFTLSKDGNAEIYLHDLTSGSQTRLTNNSAIDTEPAWSPDGNSLVFTSDRGGSPQLYQLAAGGFNPQRLTFEGDYNAAAEFSPDGRYLAFVQRSGGRFRIAVMDWRNRQVRVLSDGALDESPSFAPNGRMIIYATADGGRGELAAVSIDGRVRQRLALRASDVREPAWSPYGN